MGDDEGMLRLVMLLLARQGGQAEFTEEFIRGFDFNRYHVSLSEPDFMNGVTRIRLVDTRTFHPADQDPAPKTAHAERLDRPRTLGPGYA